MYDMCVGRTFPVEILYCKEPEPDYLEAALITGKLTFTTCSVILN